MKKYTYNNKTYDSLYQLRFENNNLIFPTECPEDLLEATGIKITEVPDPEPVKETPITAIQRAKDERRRKIDSIVVTVDGMDFEGNEIAQTRMSKIIVASELEGLDVIEWVLADDSVEVVTLEQLRKAFILANKEMERLWLEPYENSPSATTNTTTKTKTTK